jgi:hypothetical protein
LEGGRENGAQQRRQVEVETNGGEDGVDAVAVLALEVVALHSMVGLEVTDHRLDGGAALHLAFDGGGGPPDLAANPDAEAVGVVVSAIALDVDAPDLDASVPLDVGDGGFQRVAVEGIAVQSLGVQDDQAAKKLEHQLAIEIEPESRRSLHPPGLAQLAQYFLMSGVRPSRRPTVSCNWLLFRCC